MDKIKQWSDIEETIYPEDTPEESKTDIYSIWDFLSFSDNTQAFHLINVIGFDEWVDMEEIRRICKERSMSKIIGGPKPCGCIGVGHLGWCYLASTQEKHNHQSTADRLP